MAAPSSPHCSCSPSGKRAGICKCWGQLLLITRAEVSAIAYDAWCWLFFRLAFLFFILMETSKDLYTEAVLTEFWSCRAKHLKVKDCKWLLELTPVPCCTSCVVHLLSGTDCYWVLLASCELPHTQDSSIVLLAVKVLVWIWDNWTLALWSYLIDQHLCRRGCSKSSAGSQVPSHSCILQGTFFPFRVQL